MSYSLCVVNASGNYEVFCVDCKAFIGTMTGDTVRKAIIANIGKGGVKCPDCRKHTCKGCNGRVIDPYELSEDGKCFFCFNQCKAQVEREVIKERETGQLLV